MAIFQADENVEVRGDGGVADLKVTLTYNRWSGGTPSVLRGRAEGSTTLPQSRFAKAGGYIVVGFTPIGVPKGVPPGVRARHSSVRRIWRAYMEIRDGGDFVQIEVVDRVPDHRSLGDMEWSIAISSARFQGQAFAWIYGLQMQAFLEDLRKLEAKRQGAATLTMSPTSNFAYSRLIDGVTWLLEVGWLARDERRT